MRKIVLLSLIILALLYISAIGGEKAQPQFASNRPEAVDEVKPAAAPAKESEVRDAYAVGLRAFISENYYKAIEYFKKVPPEDVHYQEAVKYLEQAKKEVAEQLMIQGQNLLQAGDYKAAVKALEEALYYNPDLKQAQELLRQAEEKQEESVRIEAKGEMKSFNGEGDIVIAVQEVQLKNSSGQNTVSGTSTYVFVSLDVKNNSKQMIRIIPNNFTLEAAGGRMSSIDYDTYSLSDYLKPIDLKPGENTTGKLVFQTIKENQYILIYSGYDDKVSKKIVP